MSHTARPLILIASANDHAPSGTYLAELAAELRGIRDALDRGHRAQQWEVDVRANVTLGDLLPLLRDPEFGDRVVIFHFSGHAAAEALFLEGPEGRPHAAHAGGLTALLGSLPHLRLAFLNGCETHSHADALIAAGVPSVIATHEEIADAVAAGFAVDVYHALADGRTLLDALRFAEDAARTRVGDDPRAAYREVAVRNGSQGSRWPWSLHPAGAEHLARWTLADLVGDPRVGMPPLPAVRLPACPYRHLRPFTRADAPVFFGRGWEIRRLYDAIADPAAAPVVLLYGGTGAGKSSLLDAGVLPRLDGRYTVRYERRSPIVGLRGTLRAALGIADEDDTDGGNTSTHHAGLLRAWCALEHPKSPVVVILDQAEEAFTRPLGEPLAEIAGLADDIAALLEDPQAPNEPPRLPRKIVLSFRKEWLAEMEAALEAREIWFSRLLVGRLNAPAIVEAVRGPADDTRLLRQYHLEVEPGLAETIASDLLADPHSQVAPTLQVLLARMWDTTPLRNGTRRVFDHRHYRRLQRDGILLGDFLDEQLKALTAWRADVVHSGLALDLLFMHTTPYATARALTREELVRHYAHVGDSLAEVIQRCIDLYLLTPLKLRPSTADLPGSTRLVHDTLAPMVRERFEASECPGQRARRLLEHRARNLTGRRILPTLNARDLATVEAGIPGMRALTADETRLVEAARLQVRRRAATLAVRRAEALESPEDAAALLATLHDAPEPRGGAALVRQLLAQLPAGWLRGHAAPISTVQFGPDGTRVVTASSDGTARVWRSDAVGEPVVLRGGQDAMRSAVFSPDGKWILTVPWAIAGSTVGLAPASDLGGSRPVDDAVRIWSVDGGGAPVELRNATFVYDAAFSPDGTHVVAACVRYFATHGAQPPTEHRGSAHIWRTDGRGQMRALPHPAGCYFARFTPDGAHVVTASTDRLVRVWRADGAVDPVALPQSDDITAIACSPDGVRIAAGLADGTVTLWRVDGTHERELRGHSEEVRSVAFSSDGSCVATASRDGTARVWRTDGSGEPVELPGHLGSVGSAVLSRDGARVLTIPDVFYSMGGTEQEKVSECGTVRLWSAERGGVPVLLKHNAKVHDAAFAPDGIHVVVALDDGTAPIWRTDGLFEAPRVIQAGTSRITHAVFCMGGARIVTAAEDGSVRLWHVDIPDHEVLLGAHDGRVRAVACTPDGTRVVTVSEDHTARVWRIDRAHGGLPFRGHDDAVTSAEVCPDGTRLVTGSADGTARIWRVDGVGVPVVLHGHQGAIWNATFDHRGTRVATASADGTARVWPSAGVGEPQVLHHGAPVLTAAFSPHGKRLVTASQDGAVRVWRPSRAGEPLLLRRDEHHVSGAVFSPDGARILITTWFDVRVWRSDGKDDLVSLGSKWRTSVWSAAFSPDGTRVAAALGDGTVHISPANGLGDAVVLRGHHGAVRRALFSHDGARVVTVSADGAARIWTVGWDILLARLRSLLAVR